jgi:putative hemolysin
MLFELLPKFILLVFLLAFSAYFSVCEIALTALNKIKLRVMLDRNVRGARRVEYVLRDTRKLFSTILVGSNITNIIAPVVATSIAIDIGGNKPLTITISTIIITSLVLIYCEMVPKMMAVQSPERLSLAVAGSVAFFMFVFTPFIAFFSFISKVSIKILGGEAETAEEFMSEDELKSLIQVSHEEGVLKGEDREMIMNVFEFKNHHADDIMIHRTNLTAISAAALPAEIDKIFRETCFSRLPVYEENIDNIIGILHFKDFIYAEKDGNFSLQNTMQKPFFIHKLKNNKELFHEMRKNAVHLAVILDAHGGTAGIITLEDLLEEIVGEITDEHDDNDTEIVQINENEFVAKGNTSLDLINEKPDLNIHSEKFHTIGGFIMELTESIPEKKQAVEYENVRFVVEEIKRNKIELVRVIIHHRDTEPQSKKNE